MADNTINGRMLQRNDTAVAWNSANPVLGKGELGLEIDTFRIKAGDGVKAWNALPYATVTPGDISNFGGGDMTKTQFATNSDANIGYIDKAKTAQKLETTRTIALSGDVTGSGTFDGSGNLTLAAALNNAMTVGTYVKLSVNAKGLVTGFSTLIASDIPNLTLSKISDAGTAASKNTGTAAGNVVLIGADGKIDSSVIPSIAVTDVFVADSQTQMLALSNAEKGDIAIRSDLSKTYILTQNPASALSNWKELLVPAGGIQSINGKTGTSVTITSDDIAEGSTNLYYTEERATTVFNSNFAGKSSSELSDGATILHTNDTLILNGGNAALS